MSDTNSGPCNQLVQKASKKLSTIDCHWDAIVIGAGPAGAVSALLMARSGIKVLLVDKARFPRSKVCGSCLSAKTIDYLCQAGLGDMPAKLNAAKISAILLSTTTGAIRLPLPRSLALSREALDSAIVARAEAAGAVFLPATSAAVGPCNGPVRTVTLSMALTDDTTTDQTLMVSASCVLVADGINGHSLSALPGPEADLFKPIVTSTSRIGASTIVAADSDELNYYQAGTIYMAVHRGGYVGLVRLEDNSIDLAAAFDPSFTRQCGTPQAAAKLILQGANLPYLHSFDQSHWSGTAPFTRRRPLLAASRLFIIGDAASYSEPFTGEGIAWAVRSALLVVPRAICAIEAWQDQLALDWQREHKRLIGNKQKMSRQLGGLLRNEEMSAMVIGGLLKHMPVLARPIVDRINS